ncbi:hypothetical protein DJ013_11875 [Arcticibacterium luteifluviistationis]|uniref:Uncharacterized protein n=1 Tax=Arcticibacterium luteifluviistationis TaxID=1784714 RepID=A0A2Z4GC13_9BACT|nr:hypothetical protein DJ013_11875 [Arcticibacterium luteifluviistationis]
MRYAAIKELSFKLQRSDMLIARGQTPRKKVRDSFVLAFLRPGRDVLATKLQRSDMLIARGANPS